MKRSELEAVREIHRLLREAQRRLKMLRLSATNTVPLHDGLPQAEPPTPRLERIAILILDAEEQICDLRREFDTLRARLFRELQSAPLSVREREVLTLRYVACMNFRDIQFALHLSDARVFYLHRHGLKIFCGGEDDD